MERLLARAFVVLALLASSAAGVSAARETETYEYHLEVPNVSRAASGDTVGVSGMGTFSVHPKSVSGGGTFTHTDSQGNVVASGTWTATELLSFQPYGCGIVHFPEGDVDLPDNFCGGMVKMRVVLTAGGQQFEGILTIFCIIGPNPPTSHDDPTEEGITLVIFGGLNFNKIVFGSNVYIRTE